MSHLAFSVGGYDLSTARLGIIQLLLDNDARVNVGNNCGERPLHLAAQYFIEVCNEDEEREDRETLVSSIQLLLDHGAEVNCSDNDGNTPLHWVTRSLQVVEMLLAKGANPNFRNKDREMPVYVAAKEQHIDSCFRLLRHEGFLSLSLPDHRGDRLFVE